MCDPTLSPDLHCRWSFSSAGQRPPADPTNASIYPVPETRSPLPGSRVPLGGHGCRERGERPGSPSRGHTTARNGHDGGGKCGCADRAGSIRRASLRPDPPATSRERTGPPPSLGRPAAPSRISCRGIKPRTRKRPMAGLPRPLRPGPRHAGAPRPVRSPARRCAASPILACSYLPPGADRSTNRPLSGRRRGIHCSPHRPPPSRGNLPATARQVPAGRCTACAGPTGPAGYAAPAGRPARLTIPGGGKAKRGTDPRSGTLPLRAGPPAGMTVARPGFRAEGASRRAAPAPSVQRCACHAPWAAGTPSLPRATAWRQGAESARDAAETARRVLGPDRPGACPSFTSPGAHTAARFRSRSSGAGLPDRGTPPQGPRPPGTPPHRMERGHPPGPPGCLPSLGRPPTPPSGRRGRLIPPAGATLRVDCVPEGPTAPRRGRVDGDTTPSAGRGNGLLLATAVTAPHPAVGTPPPATAGVAGERPPSLHRGRVRTAAARALLPGVPDAPPGARLRQADGDPEGPPVRPAGCSMEEAPARPRVVPERPPAWGDAPCSSAGRPDSRCTAAHGGAVRLPTALPGTSAGRPAPWRRMDACPRRTVPFATPARERRNPPGPVQEPVRVPMLPQEVRNGSADARSRHRLSCRPGGDTCRHPAPGGT
jgi:hypothetical protein